MKLKHLLTILFFLNAGFSSISAKIITYPSAPKEIELSDKFEVRIKDESSDWQTLKPVKVWVNSRQTVASSMVKFDFEGSVKFCVKVSDRIVKKVKIRPAVLGISTRIKKNAIYFSLDKPMDISLEINDDIYNNLQIFTDKIEDFNENSLKKDTNTLYFGPGYYKMDSLVLHSNQQLYLAAGAYLNAKIVCNKVENVRVFGRGMVYRPHRGVQITFSKNVRIENIVFVNPAHYTVFGGQSNQIHIYKIRSFSNKGWSDGIDLMSCSDVQIDKVFMRNSDDCIALYGHRWEYYGDCRNVNVTNSTLWADVAHPIMIGTHGNPLQPELLENLNFKNIDILEHNEFQIDYQGCMAINVSDENLVRNVLFEDIRVDDFTMGQLINLRVTYNKKYATAPGRGIRNVLFKNVEYNGTKSNISILEGYSEERNLENIVFEGLKVNGKTISPSAIKPGYMKFSDFARIYEGLFTHNIIYKDR